MTSLAFELDDHEAPAPEGDPRDLVSRTAALMGGRVGIHVVPADGWSPDATGAAADILLRRIAAWADRLTRFDPASELSRLNGDSRREVPVGPTLAEVLDWGRQAEGLTDGIVDVGFLDARLAAEGMQGGSANPDQAPSLALPAARAWSLDRRPRGAAVRRPVGLLFDLDGIGKGWLADRALARLDRHRAAVVDADGDVAIRLEAGLRWSFGVADPRLDGHDLATLQLDARECGQGRLDGRFGLATSGTGVHRWHRDGMATHHLIDPRTGRSARTDVVQATVLSRTARAAEALAKTAVILGSVAGYAFLERAGVDAALLLTERGELVIHAATTRWLA